jgi:hypothetical protein
MFIYNVTTKVDHSIANAWVSWMLEEHGPQMVATGCFSHFHLLQLLDVDDTEGPTYAVQYFAEDRVAYERYINQFATQFRQEAFDKWGNRFMAFRTLMKAVN